MKKWKYLRPGKFVVCLILHNGQIVGEMIAARSETERKRLDVTLFDWTDPQSPRSVQTAKVLRFGYHKITEALSGMRFGTMEFEKGPVEYMEHWETALDKAGYYTRRVL